MVNHEGTNGWNMIHFNRYSKNTKNLITNLKSEYMHVIIVTNQLCQTHDKREVTTHLFNQVIRHRLMYESVT